MLNKFLNQEIVRFLLVGIFNTFFGYLLFVIFFYILDDYKIAYTLAYVIAAIKAFSLYSKIVFKENPTLKTYILYPFGYILQYFIGILSLSFVVHNVTDNSYLAALITLPITVIVSYIYNKLIFSNMGEKYD